MTRRKLLTWIELSEDALNWNLNSLSRLAGKSLLSACVKGNAYGHGLPEITGMISKRRDVMYLTVHSIDEAAACRSSGWKRKIMLLGPAAIDSAEAVIKYDLEPVVFNAEFLTALGRLGMKHKCKIATHIKLETGTNRQGITDKDLPRFAKIYARFESLQRPLGASMHFANIEDTTNHEYAQFQLDNFKRLIGRMEKLGIKPKLRHTASSAALILFDKTHFELVRPGIGVYGLWPSRETYLSYRLLGGENDIFRPVLSWKTRVTQIKDLEAGSFIGYGCTYRTTVKTRLAILPIGYADGYDRNLSNRGHVLIRGKRAPIRGRICMNLMMVDVTHIRGVRLEDEVTLIGRDRDEVLSAEQLADWAGTINYEILARIGLSIVRVKS